MAKKVFNTRDNTPGLAGSSLIRPSYNDTELKKAVNVEVSELIPQPKATDFNLVTLDEYNRLLNDFDNVILQFQNANILSEEFRLQVTDLQRQVEDLQAQLESAGKLSESLQKQIEDLTSRLNKAMSDFNSAIQRATEAESRNAELSGQVNAFKAQISALQSQINSLNSLISGGAAAGGGGGFGGGTGGGGGGTGGGGGGFGGGGTGPTPTPTPTTTPTTSIPTRTPPPGDIPREERIRREEARRDKETPNWREPIEAEIRRARDYWYTLPKVAKNHASELFRIFQIKNNVKGWICTPYAVGDIDGRNSGAPVESLRGIPFSNAPDSYEVMTSFLKQKMANYSPMVPDLRKFNLKDTSYEVWDTSLPIEQASTILDAGGGWKPTTDYDIDNSYRDLVCRSADCYPNEWTSPVIRVDRGVETWDLSSPKNFVVSLNDSPFLAIMNWLGFYTFRSISESASANVRDIPFGIIGIDSSAYKNQNNPTANKPGAFGDPYRFKTRRGSMVGIRLAPDLTELGESHPLVKKYREYIRTNGASSFDYKVTIKKTIYNGNGIDLGTPIGEETLVIDGGNPFITDLSLGLYNSWLTFGLNLENNVEYEIVSIEEGGSTFNLDVSVSGDSLIVPLGPYKRLPGGASPGLIGEFVSPIETRNSNGVSKYWFDPYNKSNRILNDGESIPENYQNVPSGTKYRIKVPRYSTVEWVNRPNAVFPSYPPYNHFDPYPTVQVRNKKIKFEYNGEPINIKRRFSPVFKREGECIKNVGYYIHNNIETRSVRGLWTNVLDQRPNGWESRYVGLESTRIYANKQDAFNGVYRNATASEIRELAETGFFVMPSLCGTGYFDVNPNTGDWGQFPENYPDIIPLNVYPYIDRDSSLSINVIDVSSPWNVTTTSLPIQLSQQQINEDPTFKGLPVSDQEYVISPRDGLGQTILNSTALVRGYKLYTPETKINIDLSNLPSDASIRKLRITLSGGADLDFKYGLKFEPRTTQDVISPVNIEEKIAEWGYGMIPSLFMQNQNTNFTNTDWRYYNSIIIGDADGFKYMNPNNLSKSYIIDPSKHFNQFPTGQIIKLFLTLEYANWDGSSAFEIYPILFGRAGTGTSQNPLISVVDTNGVDKTILNGKSVSSDATEIDFKIITQKTDTRWIIAGLPDWIIPQNLTNTTTSFTPINGIVAGVGSSNIKFKIASYISSLQNSPSIRQARIFVQDATSNINYSANINSGTNYAIINISQNKGNVTTNRLLKITPSNIKDAIGSGENRTITIDTNNDNNLSWKLDINVNWIEANTRNGKGNQAIELKILPNNTLNSRDGILTVSATDGTPIPSTLTINQLSNIATTVEFKTDSSINAVSSKGITFEVDILTNNPNLIWTLESNETWVKPTPISGNGTLKVPVQIQANTTLANRSATLVLKYGTETKSIQITQLNDLSNIGTGGTDPNIVRYNALSNTIFNYPFTFEYLTPDNRIIVKTLNSFESFDFDATKNGVIIVGTQQGTITPASTGEAYTLYIQNAFIETYFIVSDDADTWTISYIDGDRKRTTLVKPKRQNETGAHRIQAVRGTVYIVSGDASIQTKWS